MKYIIDTHVHTKEVSPCSRVSSEDMVSMYSSAGYSGLIITDHYYRGYFENILPDMSWDKKIDSYLTGYRNATRFGKTKGMDIFLSAELTFSDSNRDYIIYGLTEELLYSAPELYNQGISAFRKFAAEKNLFIVQAHPFRPYLEPPSPIYLDAVEVHNGNRRHFSDNDLALKFSERYGLYMVSGSDFHQPEDLACGGIMLPDRISSLVELISLYRSGYQPFLLR